MHVAYQRMLKLLAERGISAAELRKGTGLSARVFTRIRRSEPVTVSAPLKIAGHSHHYASAFAVCADVRVPLKIAGHSHHCASAFAVCAEVSVPLKIAEDSHCGVARTREFDEDEQRKWKAGDAR